MNYPASLESAARARIGQTTNQISTTLRLAREGRPLAAENPERLVNRIQAKLRVSRREAESVAMVLKQRGAPMAAAEAREAVAAKVAGPEAIWGDSLDFVGVAFLARGLRAARTVARVAYRDGRPQGSGFLISNRLFITNNHVIPTRTAARNFCLEFDYEADVAGRPVVPTIFELDPAACFITDDRDDLDYTVLAVGAKVSGPHALADYGFSPISDAANKHALGEVANIVQHPDGRLKEVVLRENRLSARLETVLHYIADTEPGSSGSPVFNNEWQAIALHHWGGPWRQQVDADGNPLDREVNEGIRISAIVAELKSRRGELSPGARALLQAALDHGESSSGPAGTTPAASDRGEELPAKVDSEGRVTWRLPLEISVRIPALAEARADKSGPTVRAEEEVEEAEPVEAEGAKPDPDYSERSGYKANFITGVDIPLPKLASALEADAAPILEPEPGDDPHELKYHHFSIVMNGARRLAFFTACNIDGSKAKKVNRDTGKVSVLRADDPSIESMGLAEGAEASESWFPEPRISPQHQTPLDQYAGQKVPGFPNSRDNRRLPRMLQRGHLVRRMDPAWGSNSLAVRADADTFHVTNCAPQIGYFNMGTAAGLNLARTERGALWRAIENYVLRNAVDERARVSCFTGPVFSNKDLDWRGIKIPLRFWKIVVWRKAGRLHSLAMIADQKGAIDTLAGLPESVSDAEEFSALGKVDDFITTVAEIERLTKLDFGENVRNADVRAGQESAAVESWSEIPLTAEEARRPARRRRITKLDELKPTDDRKPGI